jgi:LuxR family maltose regulon positive regulatory protein
MEGAKAADAVPCTDRMVATKLLVPPLRTGLVLRARLLERLSECARRRLTVVSAPAGFGKTTLLADWAASPEAQAHTVAWLSIDPDDDDPARFARLVAAALRSAMPDGSPEVPELPSARAGASVQAVVAALFDGAARPDRDLVLVLDDYHLIHSGSIHDAMALALERLPPSLHVVIASRSSPPLPLARLRARGELGELRAADVRFTVEEAAALLEGTAGSCLAPGIAETLAARTEGWGAGLQLAALSLQGHEDPESQLAAFTGSQRLVHDYLAEEVFRLEPPEVQAFLLRTSILDRLCGPLCDAVTSPGGARRARRGKGEGWTRGASGAAGAGQRMLERLERDNLFLVPLDEERRWWRYHRLFAEFLRRRMEEERGGELDELHRRAALWLEENGSPAAAVGHAVEVRDFERAARLLDEAGYDCIVTTRPSLLLRWLGALPEAVVRSRPSLGITEAWTLFQAGQLEAAEERLAAATAAAPRDRLLQEEANLVRGYAAVWLGDPGRAVMLAGRALRRLPRDDARGRACAHITLGLAHQALGNFEAAWNSRRRAQAVARLEHGLPWFSFYSTTLLGDIELYRGQLRAAAQLYEEALRLAYWGGEWAPAPAAHPHARLGYLSYQWNDLASAARQLDAAIEVGTRSETSDFAVIGSMKLAHVRQSQGDVLAARRLAERAEKLMRCGTVITPFSINVARALQVRLWLRQEDVDGAARWALSLGKGAPGIFQEDLHDANAAWARVMLRLGRTDEVVGPLRRWLREARSAGKGRMALELEVLRALALSTRGDTRGAQDALDQALAQARPEGFVRMFLDEGEPMARLLEQAARRRSATGAYARGLLAALRSGGDPQVTPARPAHVARGELVIEPLGKREREILALIADGLSNPEIAERLLVGVATVKTHINNLYSKLGARSRTDAIARARRMGMV